MESPRATVYVLPPVPLAPLPSRAAASLLGEEVLLTGVEAEEEEGVRRRNWPSRFMPPEMMLDSPRLRWRPNRFWSLPPGPPPPPLCRLAPRPGEAPASETPPAAASPPSGRFRPSPCLRRPAGRVRYMR